MGFSDHGEGVDLATLSLSNMGKLQLKHMPSCAKSGAFGCGGRDYSSDYGHVHQV